MDEVSFDEQKLTVMKGGQVHHLDWKAIKWVVRSVTERATGNSYYLMLYDAENNYIEINNEMKGWADFVGVLSYRVGGKGLSQLMQTDGGFFCPV